MKKLGIIGGGQLGQMLTQAAQPMDFEVIILDPGQNSPAAQVGAKQLIKNFDEAAINELAEQVEFMTTEFEEGLDPAVLAKIAKLNPPASTIGQILDKYEQKNYLSANGVAMGDYAAIGTPEDAYKLLEQYGGKMLIKTRRGGYDGYGNRVVSSKQEIDQALADFADKAVYAEAFVPFVKELAVMVIRGLDGNIVNYPVVETIQKNNICHVVIAPAQIDEDTLHQAETIAYQVAGLFDGAGAFGIEMFLTDSGEVWLNEIAPRVHNSGHYTIEANHTSQFENHVRAVTNMELGPADMKVPAAVMINILGERDGPVELSGVEQAEADPNVKVHIYGKSPTKTGRKMGHLTAVGETVEEAKQRAETARALINI